MQVSTSLDEKTMKFDHSLQKFFGALCTEYYAILPMERPYKK